MAAKNESPQRLIIGPWSHVGMRGDGTWTLDVDYGPTSVWGVQRYFDEQLDFFNRWLPDDATGHPADEAPVKIFVMGGGSGRKTELGKLDHGGGWRDEQEWPLARATEQTLHLHADGSLRTRGACGGRRAAAVHVRPGRSRPDDRRPLLRRRRDAVRRRGARAGVGAPAQPGAHAPEHHDSRAPPTRRSRPSSSPRASPTSGCRSGPTCSSTRPSRWRRPWRSRAGCAVELSISSSAVDTDFTAKLIDVYPPNEDYPEGYDLLLNDTIIRTRYREGFDREVLMEPGTAYTVKMLLPPTSQPLRARPSDPRRRLLVELPAARAQPEHRRADRPAHAPRRRRADGARRHGDAARHPVDAIDWVAIPAGPFPMGIDPARCVSAGRGRDAAAESSRSRRSGSAACRSPATTACR